MASEEFPADSPQRIRAVQLALSQVRGSGLAMTTSLMAALPPAMTASMTAAVSEGGAMAPHGLSMGYGMQPLVGTDGVSVVPQAGGPMMMAASHEQITSAAEAAINAAMGLPATAAAPVPQVAPPVTIPVAANAATATTETTEVTGILSQNLLVHNMFDKDEETEEGWERDIHEDFEEECSKYGAIKQVTVEHLKAGGMIYARFETADQAQKCATALQGRWFDKRRLRVEYVTDELFPESK
eukprot:CAMPEP_0171293158 /NCGR_PEP_ID=MMETSP0816-20121228/1303_1 /TAXON_ID=420281 /ORGANISM="Proboscia inermis, Strain CCAP1064/1" /LENGTH=240 /DNA_ID=CAMNT_0011763701 /DNA_START=846 /DNA_END=1568 /DNA_ORIENTATION=-